MALPGLPMIMDYAESNPLVDSSGSWPSAINYVVSALTGFISIPDRGSVSRGSALRTSLESKTYDAIITDPPYYDSRSYSNLSDHFYVWHKQSIGNLFPEHFGGELTPKKTEAIAAPYRHAGVRKDADNAYEKMMQKAFEEAGRLLKPACPMVCVCTQNNNWLVNSN